MGAPTGQRGPSSKQLTKQCAKEYLQDINIDLSIYEYAYHFDMDEEVYSCLEQAHKAFQDGDTQFAHNAACRAVAALHWQLKLKGER